MASTKTDARTGAQRIADERERQVKKLGWDAKHDADHTDASLAWAAVCYAAPARVYVMEAEDDGSFVRFYDPWPWSPESDKRPSEEDGTLFVEDRLRQLEKAGALIAAEIDRLLAEMEDGDG